mmetsp:Transcript_2476/g.5220  ORF Transcript_2476/g.5220 Transcript_2476/m.5220 type:complete len:2925 (-) Transcript_2476:1534-10308(-)
MAKKAILEVLESTIGRYVLNLDAESLNVAVWSGKIELQSLQLDVAAVNAELSRRAHEAPNLASPFKVTEGRFETVQLDVPWARLSSRPVVFRARGLWVYMEPHDFLKEDSNAHVENRYGTRVRAKKTGSKKSVVGVRMNSIASAEVARQRASAVRMAWDDEGGHQGQDSAEDDSEKSDSSSFTSRLVRRIIENLQVEIEDVHIGVRGFGCAAGLVLGSLSLSTTDAKGSRTFVDRKTNAKDPASSFLYKELLISGLGIYLQNDDIHQDSIQRRMLKVAENAEYVLEPLSFQAKLRQSDLDHCVDFPKYLVHSKLSSLSIQLSRNQLELGQRMALAVAPNTEIRPLFPEYRPLQPIAGNAKQWWRYAVRCIGRLNRQRSWIEFFTAFRKRKTYLELYKRHAHAQGTPWLAKLKVSEWAELEMIENDRSISIDGLMHWRTIADAQVGKEREKTATAALNKRNESMGVESGTPTKGRSSMKSSFASSLFGNSPRKESSASDSFYECLDDNGDAPITLTTDEMKELEDLAMKKADTSLTKDSMFCDVNFNLGSFQVNLVTASNQPLTSLEMGMVSASFKANADGSFTSGLSLLSLEVMDSVTPNTFFPTICRSLQKAHSNKSHAFQFQLRKSKEGDQELVLKMVACEIVASPMLLLAVKEFFKLPEFHRSNSTNGNNNGGRANPMLYESVSGDEDVFFDAKEGMSTMILTPSAAAPKSQFNNSTPSKAAGVHGTALKDGKVSDKLSSAMMDAWNGKNQQKQQWKMDFDISAPILILPENCTEPNATVLICNFGRFNFTYGTEALSPAVLEWFGSRQRAHRMDSEIDHLKLEMNDLSFTISSVSEASKNKLDEMDVDVSNSVIEPISFTLDIGLEHTISGDSTPRTCVIGVLPGIVLRLAPSHVTKILRVAGIWASNLHKLRGEVPIVDGGPTLLSGVEEESPEPDLEIMSSGSGISTLDRETPVAGGSESLLSKKDRLESMLLSRQSSHGSNAVEFMHVSVSLLRLSINMYTDQGDGLEAHLVSVVAQSSLTTDGTSSIRLSMGWFWILDRLASEQQLPRRQRLVCHSNLPRSATEYARNDQYEEIMSDLTEQGVFKSNYAGSQDLADINIVKLPTSKARAYHDQSQEFSRGYMESITNVDRTTVVNAKFTSLFVNWNPPAITTLFAAKLNVLDFKEEAYSTYERMSMLHQQDHRPSINDKQIEEPVAISSPGAHSIFILAEMDTFEISLNSAKDDLPLFTLTMSGSKVNHHSLEDDDANSEMNLVVGDFRMETTRQGKTLELYRTILGLAPSASTSLLTLKYSKGSAVRSCNVGGADKLECEACAEIVLSPMRFVHVHSQAFTLIEYVTEGVFGAMAASVASSAATAAMEVAKSSQDGERLFYIVASGFNCIVPQAAYSEKHFSFHSGNFEAHYRAFEGDIGSEANVSLNDVSMNCNQNMQMVSAPVNMSVTVKLKPPFSHVTEDERATRVEMSISRIRLLVARCHYAQMMHTIDYNIGEQDNFLREEKAHKENDNAKEETLPGTTVNSIIKNLSHAGVEDVEVIKRMYIDFHIQELSVELCGATTDDPIMSLAAVKAHILMKLLPDEKQTKASVTLHDLVCDDRRIGSVDHTFRRMIGRANVNRMASSSRARDHENESEVFLLNYTKNSEDDSRDIEVTIGSSQVVVLPDVISDMLNFIKVAPYPYQRDMSSRSMPALSDRDDGTSMQVVVSDDDPEVFEACFGSGGLPVLKKTNYRIESSNMRLVLVDLGSIDSSGPFVSTKKAALTETIVLQGKMKAKFEMTNDRASDMTVEKDYKIDAERVEIYTAQGSKLLHPVQILEPAKFAVFYYQNVGNKSAAHLTDVKFVTLSPIDLTVSMQNAALASALASSISDSFSSDEDSNVDVNEFHSLSVTDASRLARLDSALMKDADESAQCPSEHRSHLSVHDGKPLQSKRRVIRLKMTSPEAALTVTNDFQGLDEALFKIIALNAVFGGEIAYPGVSAHEKPCFGCNINTSILADYFDASSNRWEALLTSPWELTFNASRAPQTGAQSKRMSTTFDIESSQCHVSFSEHFLVNVGAASRMWSVYSGATKQATALVEESAKDDSSKRRLSRSMAAHAARSLITTLPYAIENHSGISASYSIYDDPMIFPLPTSSTQFFRFELFPERGSGGMRTYGQDIKHSKSITLYVGNKEISIQDMDKAVNKPRSAYYIPDIRAHVFVNVVKRGNSTVLHISSHVEMHNSSSLPFRIAVIGDDCVHDLGVVKKSQKRKSSKRDGSKSLLRESEDLLTHSVFGLPAPLLRSFTIDTSETLCLQISPVLENSDNVGLAGMFNLPPLESLVEIATSDESRRIIEVACSPISRGNPCSSLAANICCKVSLVDGSHPFIELFIEPRAILKNKLPVSILLRTPMPHTFISSDMSQPEHSYHDVQDPNYTAHRLRALESVEVFTPGPSIAISMRCADLPIGGTSTGWVDGNFLDIPLKGKILEPMNCTFPFQTKSLDRYESLRQVAGRCSGNDFYVLDSEDVTPDLKEAGKRSRNSAAPRGIRTVVFIVCNYAVDHTGNLLFEKVLWKGDNVNQQSMKSINSATLRGSPPYSAFSSTHHRRRVSLLPDSSTYIRLVKLTMDGDEGMKRSVPFRVEDCSMTEGIDSTPILWGDTNTPSGYFAYRHLTSEGSELHVVPEFVIFNGSEHHQIWVKQLAYPPFLLDPSKISPISRDRNNSIVVQFEIPAINGLTGPVQIDKVGLRICVAKSKVTGEALGSLAVQTVTGARDSRLVIKIGALNFRESENDNAMVVGGLFTHDFIRFRVRWSEMRVTLKDTEEANEKYEENRTAIRKYLEHHNVNSTDLEKKLAEARHDANIEVGKKRKSFPDVAQILLHRFTVDFQRIFKEEDPKVHGVGLPSSERAQFSVVVHNVRITDCSPNTESSIVFDSMSDKSFF